MRKLLVSVLCVLGQVAFAQIVLYEEFYAPVTPGAGDQPLALVGWTHDIPDNFTRLFAEVEDPDFGVTDDGAGFAFQNTAQASVEGGITTAFYTTIALDNGSTGMAFPNISFAASPELTFHLDLRGGFDADNIETRLVVLDNGIWYASATAFAVPPVDEGAFQTYSQAFNPVAADWVLTDITGTGTGSAVTLGAAAPSNLTGNITGAGFVVTHTIDNGTHDFGRFQITAIPEPCAAVLFVGALWGLVFARRRRT